MPASKADNSHQTRRQRAIGTLYKPICKILILIGIAAVLLSIATIWQYQGLKKRTSRTTATVSKISKINAIGANNDDDQKCNINYNFTLDGVEYTSVANFNGGNPTADKCHLAVGSQISVNYQSGHPANNAYRIDDETSTHSTYSKTVGAVISILLVGLIPLLLGITGLYIAKNRPSKSRDNRRRGHATVTPVGKTGKVANVKTNSEQQ